MAEPTFPSRICSSASLIYFLFICPFVVFILLVLILCLCWKARKLSARSLSFHREKTLWVDLRGAGDKPINRREEAEGEEMEDL